MKKKMLSDMVFKNVGPPDYKKSINAHDLAEVIVQRLGVKRKESRANHANMLKELMRLKKENVPVDIKQIAQFLSVSQSQAYEEIRKWRTLGIIERVKIPAGEGFIKGYMLSAPTVNRLMDKVDSSIGAFMRHTRRIAKDFDDVFQLEIVRPTSGTTTDESEQADEPEAVDESEEPEEPVENDEAEDEEESNKTEEAQETEEPTQSENTDETDPVKERIEKLYGK